MIPKDDIKSVADSLRKLADLLERTHEVISVTSHINHGNEYADDPLCRENTIHLLLDVHLKENKGERQ